MFQKLLEYQRLITLFAVIWTIAVIVTSIMPVKTSGDITLWVHFDKVVHFVFYFVAAVLWLLAGYRAWSVLICLLMLSWGIEGVQQLSGWRSGDVYDGLMNMFGLFAGWLLLFLWQKQAMVADKK